MSAVTHTLSQNPVSPDPITYTTPRVRLVSVDISRPCDLHGIHVGGAVAAGSELVRDR